MPFLGQRGQKPYPSSGTYPYRPYKAVHPPPLSRPVREPNAVESNDLCQRSSSDSVFAVIFFLKMYNETTVSTLVMVSDIRKVLSCLVSRGQF